MRVYKSFFKLLLCFSAFFCAYIPVANADLIVRYESSRGWDNRPHDNNRVEKGVRRDYGYRHEDNRRGVERRKFDDRHADHQSRRDHYQFEARKHRDSSPHGWGW